MPISKDENLKFNHFTDARMVKLIKIHLLVLQIRSEFKFSHFKIGQNPSLDLIEDPKPIEVIFVFIWTKLEFCQIQIGLTRFGALYDNNRKSNLSSHVK